MPLNTDLPLAGLPLSWTRSDVNQFEKDSVALRSNRSHCFSRVMDTLQTNHPGGLILRGCSPNVASELKQRNFEIMSFGQEAVIDLNKSVFTRRALRQSVRCGRRHNSIRKIELNIENCNRLNQLKKTIPYGSKPQLKPVQ